MTTEAQTTKNKIEEFKAGDTVKVTYKIREGEKSRLQAFEGVVLSIKGKGVSKTFTVRKIGADNIGVERIYPVLSPNISSLEVIKKGFSKRAKLYYLRGRVGKAALKVDERA